MRRWKSGGECLELSEFKKKEPCRLSFGNMICYFQRNMIGIFKERTMIGIFKESGSIRPQDPNKYFSASTLYKWTRESGRK